jgi:hypothetical protein
MRSKHARYDLDGTRNESREACWRHQKSCLESQKTDDLGSNRVFIFQFFGAPTGLASSRAGKISSGLGPGVKPEAWGRWISSFHPTNH